MINLVESSRFGVLCILLSLSLSIDGTKFIKIQRSALPFESKDPGINSSSKNAAAIAQQNCEKYAEYRYVTKANSDPKEPTNRTIDCVNVIPLITGGALTQPKEYPHMALIGYGNDVQNIEWLCGGSLISEKFILGAAHCSASPSGTPRWALLGDLNITSTEDDDKPAIYEIKKIYDHPSYDRSSTLNDITLYELNTTVAISAYVRPACLHTSTSIPANTTASITGWGRTGTVEAYSTHLQKATIPVLNDELCLASFKEQTIKYDPKTMICAGDLTKGKDTCVGDAGVPLQVSVDKQVCMWSILGVSSYGPAICGNYEDGGVYTKVAAYLDWIQSIVWP